MPYLKYFLLLLIRASLLIQCINKNCSKKNGRATNWSHDETEQLIHLRFANKPIVEAFANTKQAKDIDDCWNMLSARMDTKRTATQCKLRLKTILSEYQVHYLFNYTNTYIHGKGLDILIFIDIFINIYYRN
jgi:hypothetical protein